MRALIVGLGSIGRRHLGNLRALLPEAEIAVWRQRAHGAGDIGLHPEANLFVFSLREALEFGPEIAILANPASQHVETGLELADAGISLLIEKPISHSIKGVSQLIELCAKRKLTLMVGYNLRFQPALNALKRLLEEGRIGRVLCLTAEVGQYLPDWRPDHDYRQGVSAQQKLGGGVVLELSHELDYARWLMGEVDKVSAQTGQLSDLEMDVEDTANIQLNFVSGSLGNIHLNMVQRHSSRTCRLIGTEGTLTWDGLLGQVSMYCADDKTWNPVFSTSNPDRNQMFIDELKHFLDCAVTGARPLISGEDGLRVLDIALAAKESARQQKTISLGTG